MHDAALRNPIRWLYAPMPKLVVYGYVIAISVLYVFVRVHTPTAIYPGAPHDDTLFMTLGQYLSEGEWLGPYNEFTLVKGPGFPAFLAFSYWLGIPVSATTALFHCLSIILFVAIAHRFIRSYFISGLLLTLLMWHPVTLSGSLLRVTRESIYYAQSLLVFALAVAALFCATTLRQRLWYGGLAGAALGWFWLTREEGIWVLPAIALLLLAAGFAAFRMRQIPQLALGVLVMAIVFGGTQAGFRAANWWNYGSLVSVDFKERNYQRALKAIHSVRSGGIEPAMSIVKEARKRVYAVSPSFESLKYYLDGPAGEGWATFSCELFHSSCGEIGTGWFIFALRHAAAGKGHYRSPAAASAFFGQLADEIESACAKGLLECKPQLIGELSPIIWSQIRAQLRPHLIAAARLPLFLDPGPEINPSGDNQGALTARLRFLNYPLHTAPIGAPPVSYRLSGWYLKTGNAWFTARTRDPKGAVAETWLSRTGSPDIQSVFKDPEASEQRFVLQTKCMNECTLVFETPGGAKVERKLAEFLNKGAGGYSFTAEGVGQFHVDETIATADATYVQLPTESLCDRIRKFVLRNYQLVSLPLFVVGALSLLIVSVFKLRAAVTNICYVLALMSLALASVRLGLLVLMGITVTVNTTLVVNPYYGAPVFFFTVSASIFSIAALLQLFWPGAAETSGRTPDNQPVAQ